MNQLDLSYFFTTKAEANVFLTCISAISDMLFQTNFQLETALYDQLGINKKDRFLTLLRENNINTQSLPSIKEFLQVLKEKIIAMPVLSLTIAFEPQQQTLKALSEWILVNTNQQMVFEITVDPRLVAGAIVTHNGNFFDFSIRPTVEKILTKELTRIAQEYSLAGKSKPTTHQDINEISFGR